jgi:hypothetical protein
LFRFLDGDRAFPELRVLGPPEKFLDELSSLGLGVSAVVPGTSGAGWQARNHRSFAHL